MSTGKSSTGKGRGWGVTTVCLVAVLLAGCFHFYRLFDLPPGRCYDHTTLACFAANVAQGRDPFYGVKDMVGVGQFRHAMSRATLPASVVIAGVGNMLGFPPERMDKAETLVEALLSFSAALLLAMLVRAITASWILAAVALVFGAVTPGLLLNTRAVPHVLVFPLFCWAGVALGLWLGRGQGCWFARVAAWALVGLAGLFFYAGLVTLPLFALLLTWFGAESGIGRGERLRRVGVGFGVAVLAYVLPVLFIGWWFAGGESLAVVKGTLEYWFEQRGAYAPEGVSGLSLFFYRAAYMVNQVFGGEPPRYLTQAEVDMWYVPGLSLIPWTVLLLMVVGLSRSFQVKVWRGSPWLWVWGGLLLQPIVVALTTSGEIRYIIPVFWFAVLAAALAMRGRGEPGVLAGVFLLVATLLAVGDSWLTVYHSHASRNWGAQPLFAGLEPVVEDLRQEIRPRPAGEDAILCQRLSHIRYHVALFSDMELCSAVADFEQALPPTTMEVVKKNRLSRVPPAFVLQAAKQGGLIAAEARRLWLVGLSSDSRVKALGRWCGLKPWREYVHPYGDGLRWLVYRFE